MPYINVGKENSGNIDLYYEDHGTGRPVILIHGYPLSDRAWERQVPALLGAGFRVITYDRRGFGQSSQPDSGYEYDTLAGDLHKLITKLNLRDAALVGHSMGGGEIARYLAIHGSERVSQAVFLSAIPPFLRKTDDNPDGVDSGVFDGIKKAVAADRPAFLNQFCLNLYNFDQLGGKLVSEEDIRANWNIAVGCSLQGAVDSVDAWQTDFRADLATIAVPTLIIHGDADRIVPLPNSGVRTHGAIKGSKLVVIEGGPHGIAWTHAARVNEELTGFLGTARLVSHKAA
jgi:pimeloyl-ACP methyl ester carboxylesterase